MAFSHFVLQNLTTLLKSRIYSLGLLTAVAFQFQHLLLSAAMAQIHCTKAQNRKWTPVGEILYIKVKAKPHKESNYVFIHFTKQKNVQRKVKLAFKIVASWTGYLLHDCKITLHIFIKKNIFTFTEGSLGIASLHILLLFFNILRVIVISNLGIFCKIFQKPLSKLFKEVLRNSPILSIIFPCCLVLENRHTFYLQNGILLSRIDRSSQ